jgi:hypothetical protein
MRVPPEKNDKPPSPVFELFMFHGEREAKLVCTMPDGTEIKQDVFGRHARGIVVLEDARVQDAELHPDVRGFRPANAIAEMFEENPIVEPPLPATITTYLYQLNILLKTPSTARPAFPQLFDRVKNKGARLLYPVKITYVGRPTRPPADPDLDHATDG